MDLLEHIDTVGRDWIKIAVITIDENCVILRYKEREGSRRRRAF